MPPPWVPLLLLGLTLLAEVRTWRDFRARSAPSPQDRSSLRVNDAAGTISLVLGLAAAYGLRGVQAVALPAGVAWAGVGLSVFGTVLRAWAVETLGRWFSLTIQVRPDQPVVDTGPFRVIRHPSYLGGELALAGAGLAAGNAIAPLAFWLPWLCAHAYRIGVEERALEEVLGERYRAYRRHTWRLVPFVW